MRWVLPCAALALAGCAQLFGIDNTTGPQGGASLGFQRASIGATVAYNPLDLTGQTATFYVPDKTNPTVLDATPGKQTSPNVWTANVVGTPIVQFSLPDLPMPVQHLWELPSTHLLGAFIAYEHPNPQPAPGAAQEAVSVNLAAPYNGEELVIEAIGAWTEHVLGGAELPAAGAGNIATTIPYASFTAMTPSPAARISSDDVVLVLSYAGAQLTGELEVPAFDQSDTMDTLSGNMVGVTADKTLMATVDAAVVANRFSAVRPAVGGLAAQWSITAAPGAAAGSTAGPQLAAGAIGGMDTQVMASYGNPFEALHWASTAGVYAQETRTFTFMSQPVGLSSSLREVADPATLTAIDLAAPLPEQVNLDANQLVTDGSTVTLDLAATHTITILTESMPATLYELTLTDLSVDAMSGALIRTQVLDAWSATPSFTLPSGLLQDQHTYIPTVTAIAGGFPNESTGDLAARGLPYAAASLDGGVFTVVSQ